MKIDDSNKRYSMIIAGILVISILSFSMAIIILGVGRFRINNSIITHPLFLGSSTGSSIDKYESKKSGDKHVSIAKSCDVVRDTEPGTITYVGGFYDNPLPLCITQTVVNDWWIAYDVCGGYDPEDINPAPDVDKYGWIKIVQEGKGCAPDTIGWIMIRDFETEDLGCGCIRYNFSVLELYDGPIILDSNHLPNVNDCGLMCEGCDPETRTLDKEVDIKVVTKWEGCPKPDQKFGIILVHKNLFPESPTPEINILSPVECNKHLICF